jgi:hypothetical protein
MAGIGLERDKCPLTKGMKSIPLQQKLIYFRSIPKHYPICMEELRNVTCRQY